MERRHSRAQSYPHGSERSERRRSLFEQVKDSVIDILSPSWLTDMVSQATNGSPQEKNNKNEAENSQNPNLRTNLAESQAHGLSQSFPALYENGQPSSLDFSQSSSSPGLPSQSSSFSRQGSKDFVQPGTSRGTMSQDCAQPGTSIGTRNRDLAQPNTSGGTPLRPPGLVPPVIEFTSSQLPLNRLTDKSDSVLAQDDTVSQRSNSSHSTSGCSSMIPQSGGSKEPRQDIKRRRSSGGSSTANRGTQTPSPQPENKRRKLYEVNVTWTEQHRQAQQETPLRDNSPAFKPHLFGSPLSNNPYNLKEQDLHNSPFYPGKTSFGGRNNFRSQDYAPTARRQRQIESQSSRSQWPYPVRQVVRPRARPESETTAVTSDKSKRILDLLNRIHTPMSDARKIPMIVPKQWRGPRRYSDFLVRGSSSGSGSGSGPPNQGLQVSELASISANRQVALPSQSQEKQDQSLQPKSSRNQGCDQQQQIISNKASREDRSHQRIGDDRIVAELQATNSRTILRARRRSSEEQRGVCSLRSGPTLQVFGSDHSSPSVQVNVAPVDFSMKVTNSSGPYYQFEFASPERRNSDKTASPGTSGAFQFSSPIHLPSTSSDSSAQLAVKQKESAAFSFSTPSGLKQGSEGAGPSPKFEFANAFNQGSICSTGMGFKPAENLNQGSVTDVLGKSDSGFNFKQGSVKDVLGSSGSGFSYKPAEKLKQGSVMDVLGGSNSGIKPEENVKQGSFMDILNTSSGFKPAEKLKQGSVMDILGNSGSGFKPAEKLKQGSVMDILGGNTGKTTKDTSTTDLMKQFKPSAGTWTCNICLIQNKPDTQHCAACQTPRPAVKQTSSTISTTSSTDLMKQFKPSAGTWTCDVCLIQNKPDTQQCAACQTSRSAAKQTSSTTSTTSSTDLMKQFKPLAGTWTCDICLIQNKPDTQQCAACQTSKPAGSAGASATSLASGPTVAASKSAGDISTFQSASNSSTASASQSSIASSTGLPSASQPNSTSSTDAAPAQAATSSSSKDLVEEEPPPGSWSCYGCLLINKPGTIECADCKQPKPTKKKPEPPPKPVKKGWFCPTCLVPNDGDTTICVACRLEKPAKPFKHPPGNWICTTCKFPNKETDGICRTCDYLRPGPPVTRCVPACVKTYLDARHRAYQEGKTVEEVMAADSAGTGSKLGNATPVSSASSLTTGGFKFDSSKVSDSTSGAGFKLDTSSSAINSDSQPAGSGFRIQTTAVSEAQPLGTGFKFGGTSDSSQSVGGFKFGNSSVSLTSQSASASFMSVESNVKLDDNSTSVPNDTQSKGLSFQFGNTQTSASSSSGFSFGNPTVTSLAVLGSTKTAPVSTNSLSGLSSVNSLPTGGFSFGQKLDKDPLKATLSVPGGFNFNTPVSNAVTSAFSGSQTNFATSSSIGGFTFSATKTDTKTVNSVQSGVSTMSPSGGFTFTTKQPSAGSIPSTSAPEQPKPTETATVQGLTGFNSAQNSLGIAAQQQPKPTENTAAQGFSAFSGALNPVAGTAPLQQPKPVENAIGGLAPGGFSFSAAKAEPLKPSPFPGFSGAQQPAAITAVGFGGGAQPQATVGFGGGAQPQATNTAVGFGGAAQPQATNTPAGFGGFNFKPAGAEAPKPPAFGSFPGAQGPSAFGQSGAAKRSADEDSREQSAKKAAGFSFTPNTSTTNPPFQLPGTSNVRKKYLPRHKKLMGQRASWKESKSLQSSNGSQSSSKKKSKTKEKRLKSSKENCKSKKMKSKSKDQKSKIKSIKSVGKCLKKSRKKIQAKKNSKSSGKSSKPSRSLSSFITRSAKGSGKFKTHKYLKKGTFGSVPVPEINADNNIDMLESTASVSGGTTDLAQPAGAGTDMLRWVDELKRLGPGASIFNMPCKGITDSVLALTEERILTSLSSLGITEHQTPQVFGRISHNLSQSGAIPFQNSTAALVPEKAVVGVCVTQNQQNQGWNCERQNIPQEVQMIQGVQDTVQPQTHSSPVINDFTGRTLPSPTYPAGMINGRYNVLPAQNPNGMINVPHRALPNDGPLYHQAAPLAASFGFASDYKSSSLMDISENNVQGGPFPTPSLMDTDETNMPRSAFQEVPVNENTHKSPSMMETAETNIPGSTFRKVSADRNAAVCGQTFAVTKDEPLKYTPVFGSSSYTPAVVSSIYTLANGSSTYTPAIGSSSYTPAVVSSSLCTPTVGSSSCTLAAKSPLYTPAVESSSCTPAIGSSLNTPAVVSSSYTPTMGFSSHTPASVSSSYTTTVESSSDTSASVSSLYTPTIGSSSNTPAIVSSSYTPTIGFSSHTSASSSYTPTIGSSSYTPATAVEISSHTSTIVSTPYTPAVGCSSRTLAVSSSLFTSTMVSSSYTPAIVSSSKTPSVGSSSFTPTVGPSSCALAVGSSSNTPTVESTSFTQTVGSSSAVAKGKKRRVSFDDTKVEVVYYQPGDETKTISEPRGERVRKIRRKGVLKTGQSKSSPSSGSKLQPDFICPVSSDSASVPLVGPSKSICMNLSDTNRINTPVTSSSETVPFKSKPPVPFTREARLPLLPAPRVESSVQYMSRAELLVTSASREDSSVPFTSRRDSPVTSTSRADSPVPSTSRARSPLPSTSRAMSPVASTSRARSPVPSSIAESPIPSTFRLRSPVASTSRPGSPVPFGLRARFPVPSSSASRSPSSFNGEKINYPTSSKGKAPVGGFFKGKSSYRKQTPTPSASDSASLDASVSKEEALLQTQSPPATRKETNVLYDSSESEWKRPPNSPAPSITSPSKPSASGLSALPNTRNSYDNSEPVNKQLPLQSESLQGTTRMVHLSSSCALTTTTKIPDPADCPGFNISLSEIEGETLTSPCSKSAISCAPSSTSASPSSEVSHITDQSENTGVFAFGAQGSTSALPATTSGVYAFGATPAQATAVAAPASAPAQPVFNFGQAPNMNFTGSAAPGAFAFSAAPTSGDSGRKIKKATRRLKR